MSINLTKSPSPNFFPNMNPIENTEIDTNLNMVDIVELDSPRKKQKTNNIEKHLDEKEKFTTLKIWVPMNVQLNSIM